MIYKPLYDTSQGELMSLQNTIQRCLQPGKKFCPFKNLRAHYADVRSFWGGPPFYLGKVDSFKFIDTKTFTRSTSTSELAGILEKQYNEISPLLFEPDIIGHIQRTGPRFRRRNGTLDKQYFEEYVCYKIHKQIHKLPERLRSVFLRFWGGRWGNLPAAKSVVGWLPSRERKFSVKKIVDFIHQEINPNVAVLFRRFSCTMDMYLSARLLSTPGRLRIVYTGEAHASAYRELFQACHLEADSSFVSALYRIPVNSRLRDHSGVELLAHTLDRAHTPWFPRLSSPRFEVSDVKSCHQHQYLGWYRWTQLLGPEGRVWILVSNQERNFRTWARELGEVNGGAVRWFSVNKRFESIPVEGDWSDSSFLGQKPKVAVQNALALVRQYKNLLNSSVVEHYPQKFRDFWTKSTTPFHEDIEAGLNQFLGGVRTINNHVAHLVQDVMNGIVDDIIYRTRLLWAIHLVSSSLPLQGFFVIRVPTDKMNRTLFACFLACTTFQGELGPVEIDAAFAPDRGEFEKKKKKISL
jgi:hypothetical protein